MSTAQLDSILEEAETAAANYVPSSQALTPVQPVGGALAPLGAPSVEDFVNSGGIRPDVFINVKNTGVSLGESKEKVSRIPISLDLLDLTPVYVCRIELNGSTSYWKSYNGVTTPKGEPYQQFVATKERVPGAKSSGIYPTFEILGTLTEDLKTEKGALIAEAGTTVGFTPSPTGATEFSSFYKKLVKKNPALAQATIHVDMNAKLRTNKNGNEWYVLEFEFKGVAED